MHIAKWIIKPIKSNLISFRCKTEYTVINTNIPTVYTYNALDPIIDQKWISESNTLFTMSTKYVAPIEFRHEVPNTGVPEFAFVGRF